MCYVTVTVCERIIEFEIFHHIVLVPVVHEIISYVYDNSLKQIGHLCDVL